MTQFWCGGVRLLVGWPPFEQLEGTPFVIAGRWNVRHPALGGVTVMFCWWQFGCAGRRGQVFAEVSDTLMQVSTIAREQSRQT